MKIKQMLSKQAGVPVTIPREYIEETLSDLRVGDTAFVVPWMVAVDQDLRCWINGAASFTGSPRGTSCMRVTRRSDGFAVDLRGAGRGYRPQVVEGEQYVPVVHIVGRT